MRANIILATLLLTTLCVYGADVKEGIYEYDITSPTSVTLVKVDLEWGKDTTKLEVPATVTVQHHVLDVTGIGQAAFANLLVDSIILPPSVTEIATWAFNHCSKLTYVNLPATMEEIPQGCFSHCKSLKEIALPDGIITIGNAAFQMCEGLTEMDLPEPLRVVGSDAFAQCKNLKRVVFNGPLDRIMLGAFFWCTQLHDVVFKGAVRSLNGFDGCTSLEKVVLPEGLQTLESGVFQRCTNLKEITIPQSVREMGQSVFYGCNSLKEVVLPAAMPYMQPWLFQNCTSLERLTIGEGLKSIGTSALNGCSLLRRIVVRCQQPPSYSDKAFPQEILDMFEQAELMVPEDCKSAYQKADFWKNFKNITEQDMGTYYRNMMLNVGEGGAVSYGQWTIGHEGGCMLIPYGEKATFTILPDEDHAAGYVEVRYAGHGSHYYTNELVDNRFTIDPMPENGELFVRFDDALVDVDIVQTEQGIVTLSVAKNHSLRYQIQPDEGWRVNSLTFNGEDITDQIQQGTYIDTPVLREKSTIRIAYEQAGTGVKTMGDSKVRVLGYDGGIVVDHASEGQTVNVYTLDGRLVRSVTIKHAQHTIPLTAGQVYIVKVAEKTIKIRL
ncbi:MAG: leucine-rich repeat domain-containing protein [Prevotella sp.]|nr:leucine-rich repeat domain-containing protein [Prevotella sp.]